MRKAEYEAVEPQVMTSEETELTRIVPIRTETTLTRFPFHRIAKKAKIKIKQTKQNLRGKVETTWEVRNPPGPLAYKLDTIIINRRIDEMRNRGEIRQLFKLGSLRDICEELGVAISGKTANAIKEALRENAFAGITAKIDFTGKDGAERRFEFNTTRYTVIFTGEKLPNEKRADAVYIELHPRYHEMLNHSQTRPLDYDYLRELPAAGQRLYELLSFTMFATIKHGRATASMLYSQFCQSAPLTRYKDWNRVRPQMWKIHQPHIEAGYIKSVEFEEVLDANGVIDWVMKYTPGRKAKAEYRVFNEKPLPARAQERPQLVKAPQQEKQLSVKQETLLASLLANKVEEETARELVEKFPDRVESELEAFPHRRLDGVENPAGLLISAIKSGKYSQPPKVEKKRAEKKTQAAKKRREEHEAQFRMSYISEYLRPNIEALETAHPEAFAELQQELSMWDGYKHRPDYEGLRLYSFEKFAEENPGLKILTFWQWDKERNPEAFKTE